MTALRNRINKLQRTVIIQTMSLGVLGVALCISLSFNISQAFASNGFTTTTHVIPITTMMQTAERLLNEAGAPFNTNQSEHQVVNSATFPDLLPTSNHVNNYLPPVSEITNVALNPVINTVDNTIVDIPIESAVSKISIETDTEPNIKEVPIEDPPANMEEVNAQSARPTFTETEVTGNANIDLEILIQTVNEIAPELSGIEESMLQIYNETGIKPSFQLAKFCLESGYGTSNLAQNKNNIAGWNAYPSNGLTSYQNATTFSSLEECVLTVGYGLDEGYISNGRTSIRSIANRYCPANATNWSNDVKSIMRRIEKTYNSLT